MSSATSILRPSLPVTVLPLLLSAVGLATAYAIGLLLAPLTISLFFVLLLFGLASGLILASYLRALLDSEPQWILLLTGQTIAASAFVLLLIGIIR